MSSMNELQLAKNLWIADLHDIDACYTYDKKLVNLRTDNELLILSQDVIFANSYRRRSPMVTMSLSSPIYKPLIKDLTSVYNIRSCFHSKYTILAGTYWENEVKDKRVIAFYNRYLMKDPTVVAHNKFFYNKGEKHEEIEKDSGDIIEDSNDSKWSWRQSYSNFPFLLFTTTKPLINQISLLNRTEIDCVIAWNVVQKNVIIGKAYFLPYGIPDMVGEAGIAVFYDVGRHFKGVYMSEKLRDSLLAENVQKYCLAQELCLQKSNKSDLQSDCVVNNVDLNAFDLSAKRLFQHVNSLIHHEEEMDYTQMLSLLALFDDTNNYLKSDSDSSEDSSINCYEDDNSEYDDSEDGNTDIDDLINSYANHYLSSNGELYEQDENKPSIVNYSGNGDLAAVKRCTEASGKLPVNLNISRKWTEVQEKWGYDKSWEWHDDTALIAASRSGHFDIVLYLLEIGADPTLESCHICDVYETALKAAENTFSCKKKMMDEISKGIAIPSYEGDPKEAAICNLDNITALKNIIELLKKVKPYWKDAKYSSAHFSNKRRKALLNSPNSPTDIDSLNEVLSKFVSHPTPMTRVDDLAKEIRKISPMDHIISTCNHSASSVLSSGSIKKNDFKDGIYCKIISCNMKAAQACSQSCCGKCCPGPCERHFNNDGKKRVFRRSLRY